MNKDYMFLKNLYSLMESGYSVEESLRICDDIMQYPLINEILSQLSKGEAINDILMNAQFPSLFKEYFSFFKNKNCLSEAISKSLDICMMKEEYQNQLKSKLTYPAILLTFLFLFSIFVVVFLLPKVNLLFESFQIQKSVLIQVMFCFFYVMPLFFIVLIGSMIMIIVRLIWGLRHKSYLIIEKYLQLPIFRICLQKYFSLKFAIYYHELLNEEVDSHSIIAIMNQQMTDSDLKIVLYEIYNRLHEGEVLEDILVDFEYFDRLFISFFQMYIKNPKEHQSLAHYIRITYEQIDLWIANILKYLIPSIYIFVAVFVITIYVAIVIPMMNVISDI